jgi:hypothetical protein
MEDIKYCKCGCGRIVKYKYAQYVVGHHLKGKSQVKGKHWKIRDDCPKKLHGLSEEHKINIGKSEIGENNGFYGKKHNPKTIENMKDKLRIMMSGNGNAFYGKKHTEESKKQIGLKSIERNSAYSLLHLSEDKIKLRTKHMLETKKGKKFPRISEAKKKLWSDPEYVKKIFTLWGISPNKLEIKVGNILDYICPNEYTFTGDGSFVIGGIIPDYTNINGQKKVIEVFGDYWHTKKGIKYSQTEKGRREICNRFGYKLLVIWEKEVTDNNYDNLCAKILEFNEV